MKRGRDKHSTASQGKKKQHNQGDPFAGASARGAAGHYSNPQTFSGAYGGLSSRGPSYKNSKAMDISSTTQAANSTTAAFACLNFPQVGAAFYNRVGNDIFMKSIRLRAAIVPNAGATGKTTPSIARIMIVYDRQTNGAFPSLADILTDYSTAGATATNVLSGINMNNRGRFLILMDNQVVLPAIGAAGATPASAVLTYVGANDKGDTDTQGPLNMNRYQKLRGLPTLFKASTGAIGDISTGGLYLVSFGDDAGGTAGYTLNWSSRLKYADE